MDCPDIPRPLRRRVLGGCASQFFAASLAFANLRVARLPLVPRSPWGCLTTRQTSRDAADCRVAGPPEEGFVSGLGRRISPPTPALLLGGWVPTETGLAPASPPGLLWTTPQARHSGKRRGATARPLPKSTIPHSPSPSEEEGQARQVNRWPETAREAEEAAHATGSVLY